MYHTFNWTDDAKNRNALTRKFEPLQPYALLEMARAAQSEIFVDIGANIGVYSVFISSLPSVSRIISFEAAPDTFQEMSRALSLNDIETKVEAHNLALSDTSGSIEFGIVAALSGANSIVDTSIHREKGFENTISVQAARVDDILSLREKRICLKIDVEGHEAAVIEGAQALLSENTCIVQMENYQTEEVISGLQDLGYKICCTLGPDIYLSNDPSFGTPEKVLRFLEAATARMIKGNISIDKGTKVKKSHPIRRRLPGGLAFEIDGRLAYFLRKMTGRPT